MAESPFSIIIPTRERHPFLDRVLDFLSSQACPYKIIIGDASKEKYPFVEKKEIDVTYFHYPDDISYTDRVENCLKAVDTRYVMMLGDDDFVNLSLLPKLCSYLDKNPQCVVVDGQEIKVWCNKSGIIENTTTPQPLIDFEKADERIAAHCSLYSPTFYCVHRTHVLLKSFEFMKKIENLGYLFQELGASIATILQGTYYNFPDLYLIRQNNHVCSTQAVSWTDLLTSEEFRQHNTQLINELFCFAKTLNIDDGPLSKDVIKASLNVYYNQMRANTKSVRKQAKIDFISRKMKDFFPNFFISFLKKILRALKGPPSEVPHNKNLNSTFYKKVERVLRKKPFGNKNLDKRDGLVSYAEKPSPILQKKKNDIYGDC